MKQYIKEKAIPLLIGLSVGTIIHIIVTAIENTVVKIAILHSEQF